MAKKHLDFYNKYIVTGEIPGYLNDPEHNDSTGLRHSVNHGFIDSELFNLFEPSGQELDILTEEGLSIVWWASGVDYDDDDDDDVWGRQLRLGFTPLRQNIILFMAAMAGEFDSGSENVTWENAL